MWRVVVTIVSPFVFSRRPTPTWKWLFPTQMYSTWQGSRRRDFLLLKSIRKWVLSFRFVVTVYLVLATLQKQFVCGGVWVHFWVVPLIASWKIDSLMVYYIYPFPWSVWTIIFALPCILTLDTGKCRIAFTTCSHATFVLGKIIQVW